jgi:hypothetical protein
MGVQQKQQVASSRKQSQQQQADPRHEEWHVAFCMM